MRRSIALLMLMAGCTQAPNLDHAISQESLSAGYPKLIALEAESALSPPYSGDEVIEELDDRTASLWSRIGSLFN